MSKKLIAGAVCAAAIGLAPTANALDLKEVFNGNADFSIGGYVKLSVMATDLDGGDSPDNANQANGLDTFYFPGRIPTAANGDAGENSWDTDFTARESRINFKVGQTIGGHKLTGYTEIDFMPSGSAGGNELISNSYNPRLRHAFLKLDNWLFGQTWSTYMDVGVLPESVDFLAVSESTVFVRQPMIRYSSGNWQVALENSETFGVTDRDDNELPDLAANYTFKQGWGHIRLNGLLRELNVQNQAGANNDSATAWGVGVTGKVMIGKDDIKFSLNHGDGIGRYIGLILGPDATIGANGDLETSTTTAGFVAYRHWWNEQWRSSFMYGSIDMDYETGTAATSTEEADSITVNLMYSPAAKVNLGVMYIHATRALVNGAEGDLDRIQFAAQYSY